MRSSYCSLNAQVFACDIDLNSHNKRSLYVLSVKVIIAYESEHLFYGHTHTHTHTDSIIHKVFQ